MRGGADEQRRAHAGCRTDRTERHDQPAGRSDHAAVVPAGACEGCSKYLGAFASQRDPAARQAVVHRRRHSIGNPNRRSGIGGCGGGRPRRSRGAPRAGSRECGPAGLRALQAEDRGARCDARVIEGFYNRAAVTPRSDIFHRSTTSAGIPRWRSLPTHTLPSCSRHHPRGSGRKNGFTGAINMPSTRIG